MQKVNFFVFITLLSNVIQGELPDFSVNSLLNLINDERESRQMDKLILDQNMTLEAQNFANNFNNEKFMSKYVPTDDNRRMRIYYIVHKSNEAHIRLTSKKVFNYWLRQEKSYDKEMKLIENPCNIIWKDTKKIGIGYVTLENNSVVITIYEPYNYEWEPL